MGKVTKKQKKWADKYLETGNGTESALYAYNTEDRATAAAISSENLKKPYIMQYLDVHAEQAGSVLVELMNDKENVSPETRRKSAVDVLNYSGNKPTERQQKTVHNIESYLYHQQ